MKHVLLGRTERSTEDMAHLLWVIHLAVWSEVIIRMIKANGSFNEKKSVAQKHP